MVERQMSFFEEGGMTAPETEVDMASGNEVPPGSLPEEVRDDVDAQLSEGEYVIPADVLRYYGMKFFEDLRREAKADLARMDSEGRIGGEPSMEGGEELSPEEMAILQEVMAEGEPQMMNEGGMIRNPEFYGYAEGGTVTEETFNNPTPFSENQWSVGSSYFNNSADSQGISIGSYYKTYVGPNGETRLILFVNGEPTTPIPEGFKERKDAAAEQQEKTAKEEVTDGNDSESDQRRQELEGDREEAKSWAEKNYDAIAEDPIAFGMDQLKGTGFENTLGKIGPRAGMALAGPVGGIAGGLAAAGMQIENVGAARAASEYAKAQGLDTTDLDTAIESHLDELPGFTKTIMGVTGSGTGKNYYESLMEITQTRGVPDYVTQTDAVFKSSRTKDEAENRTRDLVDRYNTKGDDSEVMESMKEQNRGGVTQVDTGGYDEETGEFTEPTRDKRGTSVTVGSAAPATSNTRPNARPMNKGGLVKRRKKKK